MRVGIHSDPASHTVPGGIGVYVKQLVSALAAEPGDEELVVFGSRIAWSPQHPAVEVVRSALPLKLLYLMWNSVRRPSVDHLDVLHATNLVMPPARRLVATVHDDTIERFPQLVPAFWRNLYRRGLNIALSEARVLCVPSEATKRRLIEAHGVDAGRVVVTPLGPSVAPGHARDTVFLDAHRIREPFVLHVGTIEPRKNQPALVRAFARANLPGFRLVLAGARGWGADETTRAVAASGASDRIVVCGPVTDDQAAALYSRAHAFAFPSVYEGFGMPLLEALDYGVPAVSSTDEALVELGGDAVLAVDPSDEQALSAALERVCIDEDLRARLKASGLERASLYGWQATAEATRRAWGLAMEGA